MTAEESVSTTTVVTSCKRLGVPIWAGHHRRGWLRLSCGNWSEPRLTSLASPGAIATSWETLAPSISALKVLWTVRWLEFFSKAVIVRWAIAGESTVETTVG